MKRNPKEHPVVGLYDSHADVETAVTALRNDGIDIRRLSIAGMAFHTEERALGVHASGDQIALWGGRAAFWGNLWGALLGGAFLFIPRVGTLLIMGPLASVVLAALERAEGRPAGALGAALSGLGIPKGSVIKYETEVKAGRFLVVARRASDAPARRRLRVVPG